MEDNRRPGRVQDFTVPFLVVACILIFVFLTFVSVMYGFFASLIAAYVIDKIIQRKPLHHNGIKTER